LDSTRFQILCAKHRMHRIFTLVYTSTAILQVTPTALADTYYKDSMLFKGLRYKNKYSSKIL